MTAILELTEFLGERRLLRFRLPGGGDGLFDVVVPSLLRLPPSLVPGASWPLHFAASDARLIPGEREER
jgi:hypothetical protein